MTLRDCSHPIEDGMPVYPGDPAVGVEPAATMDADGFRVHRLALSTHAGTHVDAPSHLEPGGATLGEYGVEAFRWDARVVHCAPGRNGRIELGDVPEAGGADAVVFATGWSDHWGTDEYREHPALTRDAAARCADFEYHVGVDCPSVDPSESAAFPAHHELLGAGGLILENLTNLAGLPERVTLHAYPLPVDADGAPARVVAEF
ncbi:cyclase family protein [Salarchaeum sp. JOR-1]|uniref:cyclase family protein n=1 Tax=Salarchaeum sp. JOR-1 TaxID=2599399 RepID=UPI001198A9E4|nr:cyclase family protein [Salarchaeum sp. JOR-1]QDX41418.1 cyclase family protein [Salarchaeum sp. JOR-1]